ncbi:MAG: hypothetical protein ACM3JB_19485 [Acidobacteriaceae bacterium]
MHSFLADPKSLLAAGSLIVATASVVVSFFSFRNASRALAISQQQEMRRAPHLRVYFANAYRRLTRTNRQLFGFLVSVSNPTDIDNSIARAELRIACGLEGGVESVIKIQHNPAVATNAPQEQGPHVFVLPARIGAHETISGWFVFSLDDEVIGDGNVDSHKLCLEDTHGLVTITECMVRAWTDEAYQAEES